MAREKMVYVVMVFNSSKGITEIDSVYEDLEQAKDKQDFLLKKDDDLSVWVIAKTLIKRK